MIAADSSVLIPLDAKTVDPSSVDVDLTILWADQPYARALYNGNNAASSIAVLTMAGSSVTYQNVPSGGRIFGLFKTLKHSGTSATNMLAEK